MFKPQEEVLYNFNIYCDVKRKPNKLSINVKGEGYAVHPVIQLEQSDDYLSTSTVKGSKYLTLKPSPTTNFVDFGAVQVLDTISKKITVTNNGKYNFDYIWDIDSLNSMLSLSGGKMGGTLLKGEELNYKITFAPQVEESIHGSMMSFTVAGKYVYNILCRGLGVKPALRFSYMNFDFGPCFITAPGGSTVIEENLLKITNHDPSNNISIECLFQKTRALWVECPPTVISPGSILEVF
jgi:hydrocephalus-inducing protein